ncbi:LysR family transcriptional regulator [Nonomuraea africana]|uniref:DNA-binding transcriptional LysR family regulator n=1 Tax=Nonomuraea africana TaxID=46171 RepID=A0ABR9KNZ7_9ACTN|nr:LysR family transcriptional regulator [Nonomuraea africana]MBE1563744.1 DNA-binding transcriptional LysR family regulator [Nonomuraea africana]
MIDTRRLRTLRAVADHGTVTAAAAALHLTPSAVSQQLGALEHEVGHRLFARDGRGIRLTAVGRIMLAHADEVLAQLERAEAEVAAYTTGSAGEVSVASFATAISAVLAPAVRELRVSAPALKIRVLDAEGDRGLTMLLDDEADLTIAVEYRGAPDDQRLTRIPLYAEPFDLLLPREHAPASTLAELAEDDWIGPYPGNPVHDVITFACEREGFTPGFAHSSDDFRAVVALVGAGAGVALVPRLALRDLDLSAVIVRQIPGPERRVFAAVRKGADQHPLLRPLLATLTASRPLG